MFVEPRQQPKDANLLPLIWIYIKNMCGTKKAREQCDDLTILELTALYNHIVYVTDATDVFSETPPPNTHLYATIYNA